MMRLMQAALVLAAAAALYPPIVDSTALPKYCLASIDVTDDPNTDLVDSKSDKPIKKSVKFSYFKNRPSKTVSYLSDLCFEPSTMEYFAYSLPQKEFMKEVEASRKKKDVMLFLPSKESQGAAAIFREATKLSEAYSDQATVVPCVYPTEDEDYFSSLADHTTLASSEALASNVRDMIGRFKGHCDILAHGTGADIFKRFVHKGISLPNKAVSNTFLFAPDLESNIFTENANKAGKQLGKLISGVSNQLYVFYSHGDKVLKSIDERSKQKSLGLFGATTNAPIQPDIKNLHIFCCDSVSKWTDPFRRHFYQNGYNVHSLVRQKLGGESNKDTKTEGKSEGSSAKNVRL